MGTYELNLVNEEKVGCFYKIQVNSEHIRDLQGSFRDNFGYPSSTNSSKRAKTVLVVNKKHHVQPRSF